jgi:dsRNA-specific ribonuclease
LKSAGQKFGFVYPAQLCVSFEFYVYKNHSTERESCRIDYTGVYQLSEKEFEDFYKFHKFFYSDCQLKSIHAISGLVIQLSELFQRPIITPIGFMLPLTAKGDIDRAKIQDYLDIRSLTKVTDPQLIKPESIIQSIVVQKVLNPHQQPASWLLQTIAEEYGWTVEELHKEYRIPPPSDFPSMTINEFLVNFPLDTEIMTKLYLNEIRKKKSLLTESNPLILMKTTLGAQSFKLNNKFKQGQISCGTRKIRPYPRVTFVNDVDIYTFNQAEFEVALRMPSVLSCFFKFYPAKIFQNFYGLQAKDTTMIRALCTKSFDAEHNLEALETLGDCVLKAITALFMFVCFPNLNESQLTTLKSSLISNLFYYSVANDMGLQYFLICTPDVKNNFPLFKKSEDIVLTYPFSRKNLSDAFEAIMGALFLHNNTLMPIFKFLVDHTNIFLHQPNGGTIHECEVNHEDSSQVGLGKCINCFIIKTGTGNVHKSFPHVSSHNHYNDQNSGYSPIRFEYLDGPSTSRFVPMSSYDEENRWRFLLYRHLVEEPHCHFKLKDVLPSSATFERIKDVQSHFLSRQRLEPLRVIGHEYYREISLIENIIGYRFENKKRLIEVFWIDKSPNFERYEFFGDTILELLVVGCLMDYFENTGFIVKPERLQLAKERFLSNKAMCKFMTFYGLTPLIVTKDSSVEIVKHDMMTWVRPTMFLSEFLEREPDTFSKRVSDVWEAMAYAVFLDGGYKALAQSYLGLMAPFIDSFIQSLV